MKVIQRIFWVHLVIGVGALALGYALTVHFLYALIPIALGALWFAVQRSPQGSGEGFLFLIFCAGAGLGVWLRVPGFTLLLGIVGCLGAWDLSNFLRRLAAVEMVDFKSGLGREHVRRVIISEVVGLVFGLLALSAQAQIPFWWEALLALLAVIGISRIVAFIRKQTEEG